MSYETIDLVMHGTVGVVTLNRPDSLNALTTQVGQEFLAAVNQARSIEAFSTFMTGEFYALLRQQSILARTLPHAEPDIDWLAFDQGTDLAMRSSSLLQTAFSVRTLDLFGRMPQTSLPSFLSGLVIGEELRARASPATTEVVVVGSDALNLRYERALSRHGIPVQRAGPQATWQGLWALAQTLHPETP